MKLIKLKCSNESCGKDFYCHDEDMENCDGNEKGRGDLLCPFCTAKMFASKLICKNKCEVQESELYQALDFGEVEFDDQSALDGIAINAIHDKVESLLHDVENLKIGGADE